MLASLITKEKFLLKNLSHLYSRHTTDWEVPQNSLQALFLEKYPLMKQMIHDNQPEQKIRTYFFAHQGCDRTPGDHTRATQQLRATRAAAQYALENNNKTSINYSVALKIKYLF